jgi:hypothetical protein
VAGAAVTFEEFEQRAWDEWERIPREYKQGIDGLVIERRALQHPSLPDVYTLGECITESYASAFGGPDTIRSAVVLYYGSFFRLSRLDEAFDWEHELWETLTHELQHHLESLAADDSLLDMDYAADENFKRVQREPFDPFFFRLGELTDGVYRVEDEYFIELAPPTTEAGVRFTWAGVEYRVEAPRDVADVTFIEITDGVSHPPAALHLVLVRPVRLREKIRSLIRGRTPRISEIERRAAAVIAPAVRREGRRARPSPPPPPSVQKE